MAERVATREGRRRAIVVFTDGLDNASRLTPSDVSGIASSIDVPVYLFLGGSVDRQPGDRVLHRPRPNSCSRVR